MNFSAPNIAPSPARYPAANDDALSAPAEPIPSAGGKGEFAELFAGVTQRSSSQENAAKNPPSDSSSETGSADKADTSQPNSEKRASRHPGAHGRKQRSDVSSDRKLDAAGQPVAENPVQCAGSLPSLQVTLGLGIPAAAAADAEGEMPAVAGSGLQATKASVEAVLSATDDSGAAGVLTANFGETANTPGPLAKLMDKPTVRRGTDATDTGPDAGAVSTPETRPALSQRAAFFPRDQEAKLAAVPSAAEPVARAAADFAAAESKDSGLRVSTKQSGVKNFLVTKGKDLTESDASVGTNVAERVVAMPATASPRAQENLFTKDLVVHGMVSAPDFSAPASTPAENPSVSVAHRAVDAAMEISERFTTDSQRAVNLQFSFNGGDLAVRVEMHNGQVHATFRTDSAELRSALAHEWQSVTGGERSQRFADPVFASSGGSSFSSSGNQAESQGHGRGQEARESSARFELSASRHSSAGAESSQGSAVPAQSAMPLTALRLHTFA